MKVLIAIDDSPFSEAVINEAAQRSWQPVTEILVLSVVAIPTPEHWQDWGLSVLPEIKARLLDEAETVVRKSVALLEKHLDTKIKIEGKVVEGHTCDSIAGVASHWQADMIMMGSHGRTGIGRFLLGSVAEGVLLRAPCSVEIIKHKISTKKKPSNRKKKVTVLY